MGERDAKRAKRELREAVERAQKSERRGEQAPANPELDDSQARGGAEMATEEGRTRPRR